VRKVLTGGPAFAALARSRLGDAETTYVLRVQGEPTPDPDSRVRLSQRRDRLGMPMARVRWKVSDDDFRSIHDSAMIVDQELESRHLGRVMWTADPGGTTLIEGNHHHLGTTRMHRDPRHGVVDADCRVHSMQNLFVAGSSVFPSYGASNPTLTIVAMAIKLADHLSQWVQDG
jgi:choline dehydrogenase-like flavoprotein